jgi:hypothetical protein
LIEQSHDTVDRVWTDDCFDLLHVLNNVVVGL